MRRRVSRIASAWSPYPLRTFSSSSIAPARRDWSRSALVDHGVALLSARPHSKQELEGKLQRLCARQRQRSKVRINRFETRRGLERGSPELEGTREKAALAFESCSTAVPRALCKLEREGHVDDDAFAAWFVAQRVKYRPKSLIELRAELRSKGVDDATVRSAIAQSAYSELEACRALTKRKWKGTTLDQSKLTAYLTRRGFRRDAIQAAFDAEVEEREE